METVSNAPAWAEANFKSIDSGGSFHGVRTSAFQRFQALGLPTPANEEWKYTNVGALAKTPFALGDVGPIANEALAPFLPAGLTTIRLVFVNGVLNNNLSQPSPGIAGLTIESLQGFLSGQGGSLGNVVASHFAKHAAYSEHAFVALNTAFVTDGAVIKVERGKRIETPIHIVHVTTAQQAELMTAPRVLVVAEAHAVVNVIESFLTFGSTPTLTTAVTEIVADENAEVHHYKLAEEGPAAYHVSTVQIAQAASSRVRTTTFSFGGKVVRNEVNATLQGEECSTGMLGLTVLKGDQHVDNHTVLDHAKPRCESRELYKGIYADRSSGVFNGTIIVRPDAQKTNAFQSNRALLLSTEASIDSQPQLKIWADDVKCTHGATVGQLDEDSLFYLRSRGIPYETARGMLIHAFAGEVVSEIGIKELKAYVEDRLEKALF
jgi:Fe-S cluster assembly protein SufD